MRSENEDCCLADNLLSCFLVADGVGGTNGGKVASTLFSQTAVSYFSNQTDRQTEAVARIKNCFLSAHNEIVSTKQNSPELAGMACTAELLTFEDRKAIIGHVGDSRSYLLREKTLQQLTSDHSFVEEQLRAGLIDVEQAKKHSMRNVILRAVGAEDELEVDIIAKSIMAGDLFLLCSDGLTDMVEDKKIESILNVPDCSLEKSAESLVKAANDAGGKDNIAVVLVLVSE